MESNLKVEYLVFIEDKKICASIKTFKKLLETNDSIEIKGNDIIFENDVHVKYTLTQGKADNKQQKYFHLTLIFHCEQSEIESKIDSYEKLLRELKKTILMVMRNEATLEPLWDDLSSHYSHKAYPLIHEVENLMRKLITTFMLTKLGTGWVDEVFPDNVKTAMDRTQRVSGYITALFNVDFINLKDMLFHPYTKKKIAELYKKINDTENSSNIELAYLKEFVPTSNWDKYFKNIISSDSKTLSDDWESLYKLRCKVAHNSNVTKKDYTDILTNTTKLKSVLQEAINKLDQVIIPEGEIEEVAESVISSFHALSGRFIWLWNTLEVLIIRYCDLIFEGSEFQKRHRRTNAYQYMTVLYEQGLIPIDIIDVFVELKNIRNMLVHDSNISYPEQELVFHIETLNSIFVKIQMILENLSDHRNI